MRPTTDSFAKPPLDVSQKSTCTPPLPNAQAERGSVAASPCRKRANVGMAQAGDRLSFPLEPLTEIGIVGHMRQEHLDGDRAVQAGIGGLIHLAHAALADEGGDFIRAKPGAGCEWHDLSVVYDA